MAPIGIEGRRNLTQATQPTPAHAQKFLLLLAYEIDKLTLPSAGIKYSSITKY